MKVLIAEDDSVSRIHAAATLTRLGHECIVAEDGEAAWSLYLRKGAEVILSDWMMPRMNGLDLCRRVRAAVEQRPGRPYTYFVLLTSLEDKAHFQEGMQAGVDDYLLKPLDPVHLEARLRVAHRVTRLHEDLQEMNRKLWDLARRDTLTGLFNRLQLSEDFAMMRDHMDRRQEPWALAVCDVDYFKRYNDIYGHLAGDEALCRIADVLKNVAIRGTALKEAGQATSYRFGGEEFCLILDASLESAAHALNTARLAVRDLGVPHQGNPAGTLTMSMGVAVVIPGDGLGMDAILRQADAALYSAKEGGRDRVVAAELNTGLK